MLVVLLKLLTLFPDSELCYDYDVGIPLAFFELINILRNFILRLLIQKLGFMLSSTFPHNEHGDPSLLIAKLL